MFSRRGPILIVISLLLAVGAAWVANHWLVSQAASSTVAPSTVTVLTAAINIPLGTKIEARHVAGIQMLADTAPDSAFTEVGAIEGKIAIAEIMKGEFLLAPRFADQGGGSALAAVVGENMRAVSVRVNDVIGVAGFLLPGNRVDVVAAYRDGQDTLSETIVQLVKVLAIDQTASSDKNEPAVVRAVTLEVTPEDAEKLILAEQRGSIQLALRNPLDETITQKPVRQVAKVQTRPPPPSPSVSVIRGTELGKEVPKAK
ncbi:MAG: Flp pilus assembly protein CpaB [Steroidobacteraceae bacterium]